MINSKYLMLHYLHSKKFHKIDGSISYKNFEKIVKKNLKKNYIYTFDDGLKSQFHLAKPILEKYNQTGIFFLNTFHFEDKFNYHELSKFFKKFYYPTSKKFYEDFFKHFNNDDFFKKKQIKIQKKKFPYYSHNEIKIRLVRSQNYKLYNSLLEKLFIKKKFDFKKFHKKIYMSKSEILSLSIKHTIGLHTHSHFFNFDKLNKKIQSKEIILNKNILEKIIKRQIFHFSYPIGKYNKECLDILKKNNIKFAFKNNKIKSKNSLLIPRININTL